MSDYQFKRKQMDVTAEMLTQIQFVADTDLTADDIVVFEASAVNTLPLNKRGSIFEDGRITRSTLTQMAESVNSKNESVPLHTLHMQGDELPVGKVFYAYVQDMPDGNSELRAQFYLARSEADLIEKVNLGILDEVSIGMKSKQLLCSKCGWDYFGEDVDFLHLWDRTCSNDHTIGVDGTHAVLSGLDSWMELSLVSRGAASKAKIHGRAKKVMPQEQQDRIAASGHSPDVVSLFASPTLPQKEEPNMADKPGAKNGTTPEASGEFDAKAAHEELLGQFSALLEVLTPAEEADKVKVEEPVEVNLAEDDSFKDLKASVDSISEALEKLTGLKPADLAENLPVGGVAASASTDAKTAPTGPDLSVFKSRK